MTQLGLNWDEAEHPRDDHGKFVEVPASHTYPAFKAEVRDAGDGHITLHREDWKGKEWDGPLVKMKRDELSNFLGDLSGSLTGKPNSSDVSVNRAISGRATFLGRGNDGLAFDTDDGNVVKASSSINYHWNNGLRGTQEGANVIRRQVENNEMLRKAGVPGLLPQRLVEHEGRAYAVMPKVDTKSKLTSQQMDQVTETIKAMHSQGYTVGDDIQVGVGSDGKSYLFDTGAVKNLSENESHRRMDIDDDEGRLARFFQDKGHDFKGLDPTYNYEKTMRHITHTVAGKPKSLEKMPQPSKDEWAKRLTESYGNLDDSSRDFYEDEFRSTMKNLGHPVGDKPPVVVPSPAAPPPRQSLMFDNNKTARLFEGALLEAAPKSKKKAGKSSTAAPSLLEKIEDDLKKMHDESKPLGGQKEFFSRMFHSEILRFARPKAADKSKSKPDESKGRWVTIHGAAVFVEDGKITKGPAGLVNGKPKRPAKSAAKKSVAKNPPASKSNERMPNAFSHPLPKYNLEWILPSLDSIKAKRFDIPEDVFFSEWEDDLGKQAGLVDAGGKPVPKVLQRANVKAAAKVAAESAGVPVNDVLHLMPESHKYLNQQQADREKAKTSLRRVPGLNAGDLARMENKYQDHSVLKNWDTTSREFAANHPDLGIDPDGDDTPALIWDFLREGKAAYLPAHDQRVADLAAEWASPKIRSRERLPGDKDGDREFVQDRSGEAVPFSRLMRKFSRLFERSIWLNDSISRAASQTNVNPSDDQRAAGNYRKGKFRWNGLTIAIENPAGSIRRGTSKAGMSWSVEMQSHYGYILQHESEADGDHVDVFVGPCPESDLVCVVDQKRDSGHFDEHKVMIGFVSVADAERAYLANYSAGWHGLESITPMTVGQFLAWLEGGETGKRLADQVSRYTRVSRQTVIADKFSRFFKNRQKMLLR